MKHRSTHGFTLLEVLVAIAILGLGLTVILSSQTGLFASASRGEHMTAASNLVRCKMSEIELQLEQKGFNLTDENDEGPCCDDDTEGYSCSWKIERVELPPMPDQSLDPMAAPSASAGGLALGGLNGPGGLGAPGALGALGGPPGAAPGGLGAGGPLGALAALGAGQLPGGAAGAGKPGGASPMDMLGALGGSTGGLEAMVFGFVYPSLKPMLEASIRRVTVKVSWREGKRERDLEVTQFLARPQEGQLATAEQLQLQQQGQAVGALLNGPGAAAPGTPGATTPTTGTPTTGLVPR
ncbi:MAG TPA: type II secretion system protein [Polyangiaceae bacterium]|nr:type II secretion system protein [Polyangiaceae bacterium]